MIFCVFRKNLGFRVFLVHSTVVSVLLSALFSVCGIFFYYYFTVIFLNLKNREIRGGKSGETPCTNHL